MIERDYIMRMIAMLIAVIQKLMGLKKSHDYPRALLELERGTRQILGIPLSLLEQLPDDQLLGLYRSELYTVNAKLFVAGTILKEKAEILDVQGKSSESAALSLKALRLLLEAYLPEGHALDESHVGNIDGLIERLRSVEIPSSVRKELFAYYECRHQYDKAENTLYDLLEQDSGFVKLGTAFYGRLLSKSDDDLNAGKLPRNEVEDGLQQLPSRRGVSE